jgi:hypothetical protein
MMFRIVFWDVQGWRQYAPLKRRSTIILHGSIIQKTALNEKRAILTSSFHLGLGIRSGLWSLPFEVLTV